VSNYKKILWVVIFALIITGCGTNNPSGTPGVTVIVKTPTQSAYPNPEIQSTVPIVDFVYPGPLGGNGSPEVVSTPVYYVTQLVVPTPSSGKAVITGQLLVGGEGGQPYMTTLYLASTLPPSTPGYPPLVAYSEESDPIAIQEVGTGRFLFVDVPPGQYALIVWTPIGGNPLVDSSGGTLLFTVNPDEVKDLGIIPIQ
jgi:hypothetical protein